MKSIVVIATLTFFVIPIFILTSLFYQSEAETFEGVFDGKEDYGYNFIGVDEEGDEYTMTFQNIKPALLKSYDLQSDEFIGKSFVVDYTIEIETEIDEDGYEEDIESYTIIALKQKK